MSRADFERALAAVLAVVGNVDPNDPGAADALYVLPGGAIEFGPKPS